MSSLRNLKKTTSRQIYVDLVFSIQTLHREVDLSESTLKKVEEDLIHYFESFPDTKRNPSVICAVLVYHYGKKDHIIPMMRVCHIFSIGISWFRKIHVDYLEETGIELDEAHQQLFQRREWRWFSNSNLTTRFQATNSLDRYGVADKDSE